MTRLNQQGLFRAAHRHHRPEDSSEGNLRLQTLRSVIPIPDIRIFQTGIGANAIVLVEVPISQPVELFRSRPTDTPPGHRRNARNRLIRGVLGFGRRLFIQRKPREIRNRLRITNFTQCTNHVDSHVIVGHVERHHQRIDRLAPQLAHRNYHSRPQFLLRRIEQRVDHRRNRILSGIAQMTRGVKLALRIATQAGDVGPDLLRICVLQLLTLMHQVEHFHRIFADRRITNDDRQRLDALPILHRRFVHRNRIKLRMIQQRNRIGIGRRKPTQPRVMQEVGEQILHRGIGRNFHLRRLGRLGRIARRSGCRRRSLRDDNSATEGRSKRHDRGQLCKTTSLIIHREQKRHRRLLLCYADWIPMPSWCCVTPNQSEHGQIAPESVSSPTPDHWSGIIRRFPLDRQFTTSFRHPGG